MTSAWTIAPGLRAVERPRRAPRLAASANWEAGARPPGSLLERAPAVVDAAGIESPVPLTSLGGDAFPVHGCWSGGPGADFKALAAAQHPEDLENTAELGGAGRRRHRGGH